MNAHNATGIAQVTTGEFLLHNFKAAMLVFQTKEMSATLEKGLKQGEQLLA